MKTKFASLILIAFVTTPALSQSVVTWDFGTSSPNASPSTGLPVQHVIISDVTQGNSNGATTLLTTSSASSGYTGASGVYNAGVAARIGVLNSGTNGSGYFEFTLTPDFASSVTLTAITFGTRSTGTGPQAFTIRSSADSYASDVASGTIANNSVWTLVTKSGLSSSSSVGTAITYRIFGYNGTGSPSSGTTNWRIDDLSLTMTVVVTGNPGSGVGSASVSPYRWKFDSPTSLQFVVKPSADTINGVRIIKPSVMNWSSGNVSKSIDSAMLSFFGDTVQVSNFNLINQDTLVVTIAGVTAVDTTDIFSVTLQTFKGNSPFGRISLLPQVFVYGSPRPISQVKAKLGNGTPVLLGKWAVMKGIVTVANEFAGGTAPGGPVYIQDASAGATLYDTSLVSSVQRGDEIVVLGLVAPFNELFELVPCSLLEVISEGNSIDTAVVTILQLTSQPVTGVEPYEGKLVRINGITSVKSGGNFAPSWAVSGSGTNYDITDVTGTMQVRISPRINLANLPTPVGNFDLVCVVGQFGSAYQVLPRSIDDVIPEGNGPRFSSAPSLTAINKTSLSFAWSTDVAGTSIIKYGLTTSYDSTFTDTNKVTNHIVTISNLAPATIYQMQFGSSNSGGTTLTQNGIYSTSSQSSTGVMNVYFTKTVNTGLARGENAITTNVSQKLVTRIDSAKYSIDVALYSLSGTVGANVANALIAAKNRGVKVRVIGEKDNQSTGPWTTLKNASVPVIDDGYDATNGGAGYMHNKFLVFDNRDQTSDADDWVWTGSWNATDPGNNNDAQNAIEIQDKALANAYTLEFNEMWGSDTLTPNAAVSRFGARKLDNTPHQFVINGTPVELYFSPSDRTTSQIIRTIGKANYSVDIALLSFTRNDIANAVISRKKAGVKAHALADVHDASWSVFDTLAASGVDVRVKGSDVSGFLHHKYGIIDAEQNFVTQYVITGSHNWSSNAENSNNENTLIIQSNRIANLFLQEFGARYAGAGGNANTLTGVAEVESGIFPIKFELRQNYPNPFNPTTTMKFSIGTYGHTSLQIYNVLGQQVANLIDENLSPGAYQISWDASFLPTGVFFYRLQAGSFVETKKMLLLR